MSVGGGAVAGARAEVNEGRVAVASVRRSRVLEATLARLRAVGTTGVANAGAVRGASSSAVRPARWSS
jgi:hypothetical protein